MEIKYKEPHIHFLYEPVQSEYNFHPSTTRVGNETHLFLNKLQTFCRFGAAKNDEFDYSDLKIGFEKVVDTFLNTKLAYAPLKVFAYAPEAYWTVIKPYQKDTFIYILAPDPIFDECRKYAGRVEDKRTGKLSGTVILNGLAVGFFTDEFKKAAASINPDHCPKGCFDSANSAFYFADKNMFEKMKTKITYFTKNTKPGNGNSADIKTPHP